VSLATCDAGRKALTGPETRLKMLVRGERTRAVPDQSSTQLAPLRAMNIVTLQSSHAEAKYRHLAGASLGSNRAVRHGLRPTPSHDLHFHGGKLLTALAFKNFYVAGSSWDPSDVKNIDDALSLALTDAHLNNVLTQYYTEQPTTEVLPSTSLTGSSPAHFSQGDAEQLVQTLLSDGALDGLALDHTVMNLMLPPGTVLNDNPAVGAQRGKHQDDERDGHHVDVDKEEADSLHGLGGYHGSVHVGDSTLYYAVGVYSQMTANGPNGIPVFDQSWKNVVATFYHELNEARTDPDVEDAIKQNSNAPLGWTSREGEEIGDFPVFEANPLTLVFQEVPTASGNGTVPIQLLYSNAKHEPEGPRSTPYPFFQP
jgi:hypothetical protein